nr:unnamed protein product [Digitaria exilis]
MKLPDVAEDTFKNGDRSPITMDGLWSNKNPSPTKAASPSEEYSRYHPLLFLLPFAPAPIGGTSTARNGTARTRHGPMAIVLVPCPCLAYRPVALARARHENRPARPRPGSGPRQPHSPDCRRPSIPAASRCSLPPVDGRRCPLPPPSALAIDGRSWQLRRLPCCATLSMASRSRAGVERRPSARRREEQEQRMAPPPPPGVGHGAAAWSNASALAVHRQDVPCPIVPCRVHASAGPGRHDPFGHLYLHPRLELFGPPVVVLLL